MSKFREDLLNQFPKESCGDVFNYGDGYPRLDYVYPLYYDRVIRFSLDATAKQCKLSVQKQGYQPVGKPFRTSRYWVVRVCGKLK